MKAITCFSRQATARLQPRGLRRRSQISQQVRYTSGTGKTLANALGFPETSVCCRRAQQKPGCSMSSSCRKASMQNVLVD